MKILRTMFLVITLVRPSAFWKLSLAQTDPFSGAQKRTQIKELIANDTTIKK